MPDDILGIEVAVEGDAEAVADLGRVVQAEEKIATASRTSSAQVVADQRAIGTALTAGGQKWGQVAGAIGNVGSVLGQVSPKFSQIGSVIGTVGSASTALTGAMGPLGVGIAAITTAVGIGATAYQAYTEHQEAATRAIVEQAERAAEANHTLREHIGLIQEATSSRALDTRIAAGLGTPEEQAAAVAQAERRLRGFREALEAAQGRVELNQRERSRRAFDGDVDVSRAQDLETIVRGAQAEVDRLRAVQRVNTHEALVSAMEDSAAAADAWAEREGDREQATRDANARMAQERERAWQEEQAAEEQHARDLRDLDQEAADRAHQIDIDRIAAVDARVQREYDAWQTVAQFQEEQAEQEKETLRDRAEYHASILEREKQDALAAQEEMAQRSQEVASTISGQLTPLLTGVFQEIQKGNDSTADGFLRVLDNYLEAKAIEWGIQAVAEGAAAIASFASYQEAQGVLHLEAAAQYAVAAGLAGGAGAAISVPSAASAQATASAPQGGGQQGGGSVTINLYAPNAVLTEAERGQILASGLREARRSYGDSAVEF